MTRWLWISAAALACWACGGSSSSSGSGGAGGTATGGASTGGASTGGASTGGASTGGSGGTATGGSGGTATGGAAGSATGGAAGATGDAGDCAALLAAFSKALSDAVTCNPVLSVVQCSGTATVPDKCGCSVVLNETQPARVQAAQNAYAAWTAAGCGPYPCGAACFVGTSGLCDPTSSTCQWKNP